jgi:hypothetical protein
MTTNTAGSAGIKNSDRNGPHIMKAKILYSDWVGTNNDAHVIGVLPANAVVIAAYSHVVVKTSFNDTSGDDLDVGIVGGDDDWFASALDLNTGGGVLLTLDDLTNTERYSASPRQVTANFTTAPTGDGTMGEAYVWVGYHIAGP